jgi:ABC-2 type transport system ATP-binding protein
MVLEVHDVHYRYGTTVALDGVNLEVAPGRCVALLGPNGAGKTTLVGLATGLMTPRQGTVAVAGGDPRHAASRRHLGVVQQSVGFPRTLTVGELVRGAAVRTGLPANAAGPALAEVGISDLARRRAGRGGGGPRPGRPGPPPHPRPRPPAGRPPRGAGPGGGPRARRRARARI